MRKIIGAAALSIVLSIPAGAQTLVVNGGQVFNEQHGLGLARGNYTSLQVGLRAGLANSFEVQGAVTVLSEPSVDAALRFRPFQSRNMQFEPYAFTGFGLLFASDDFRSLVPAGLGLEYRVDNQWGIHAETAATWTIARSAAGDIDTIFGFSPTLGISYRLKRGLFSRPPQSMSSREATSTVPPNNDDSRNNGGDALTSGARSAPDATIDTSDQVSSTIDEGMSIVPDGMFIMGLADEDPLSLQTAGFKRITVTGFAIDRYEITNREYADYLDSLPAGERAAMEPDSTVWEDAGFRFSWSSYFRGQRYQNHPVVAINFDQAESYCSAHGKRLPTEAEWEYAARSGREGGIFPWNGYEARNGRGEYLANYNNGRAGYAADGYAFTAPVDAYQPSEWGLYNMSGNVAEWAEDAYSATYLVLSDFNPYHIDEAEERRVVRGGSWASDEFYIGVGVRDAQARGAASPYVGGRCVLDLSDELFISRPDVSGEGN